MTAPTTRPPAPAPAPLEAPPVLETRALGVGYRTGRRRSAVLDGLDLRLETGELTCLLGPNGSGKSTLLRTLAGLQEPLAGEVRLLGQALSRLAAPERARRLAVVLTDQPDVGLMRAADLVALGRHPHTGWAGRLRAHDHAWVHWALEATGAAGLAARGVAELSDGERQRVLVARALAQQPRVLALDEPVAFIDVPRRMELTQLLRDLARECDLAVLLTTHDLDLAIRTCDRLWLIEPGAPGAGARVHVGAPEDLVLSGAVARAFASDEVSFDLERGAFRPRPGVLGRVRVTGSGPAAVWAARALERAGFTTAAGEAAPGDGPVVATVDAGAGDGERRWRLAVAGEEVEHDGLGELVGDLAARLSPRG